MSVAQRFLLTWIPWMSHLFRARDMYICIYVYIYKSICVYSYICTYAYVCICIYTSIYTSVMITLWLPYESHCPRGTLRKPLRIQRTSGFWCKMREKLGILESHDRHKVAIQWCWEILSLSWNSTHFAQKSGNPWNPQTGIRVPPMGGGGQRADFQLFEQKSRISTFGAKSGEMVR